MSKNKAIEVYLRVRPVKNPYDKQEIDEEENKYSIVIPKQVSGGYVNNTQEHFNFKFNGILDPKTSQQTVFNRIAKDVCDGALEGFNGTIFAYGQTGSGKTFSMTGGERYDDRGIIPRTLCYLFQQFQKKDQTIFNMAVSYIEIYQGIGYDLLDEKHNNTKLEDLPKVQPRETEEEEVILSGLSVHKVEKEEDALNLLFIGDNHRVVCETPKNDASTRSHCIFIIMLEMRQPNSDVKTVSRIHLVDLSGSERIGKTGVDGKLQREATGINLSLHYLEHVIVCLNKKANGENIHIPYRNSLMTQVLRNSLGGNCRTRMIATASPALDDLDESISTCKFAQRVALIKNAVERNESVDPGVIIQRLKRENAALKAELTLLKGENVRDVLDPEEIDKCKLLVKEFIENPDPSATIILNDRLKINECFYHFKHLFNDMRKKGGKGNFMQNIQENKSNSEFNNKNNNNNQISVKQQQQNDINNIALQDEIKRLKLLVQQRDNEILIFLDLINKNKQKGEQLRIPVTRDEQEQQSNDLLRQSMIKQSQPITFLEQQQQQDGYKKKQESISSNPSSSNYNNTTNQQSTRLGSDLTNVTMPGQQQKREQSGDMSIDQMNIMGQVNQNNNTLTMSQTNNDTSKIGEVQKMLLFPLNLSNDQLMDRANCFELFRKSYRKNEVMEENKQILKQKFQKAKELGPIVSNARNKIKILKNQIEDLRKEVALNAIVDGDQEQRHPEEERLIKEIEKLKRIYKDNLDDLKDLKQDIERLDLIIKKSKDKLQGDFQKWIEVMVNQKKQITGGGGGEIQRTQNNNFINNSNHQQKSSLQGSNFDMNAMSGNKSSSQLSQQNIQVNDKEVQKNMEAFYKARDQIYKN